LRRVWIQQYYRCDASDAVEIRWRTSAEQPPSALIISSPYDVEARYKTKRETSWLGYKAHLTETCDDDMPNLITHVATTPATMADGDLTTSIRADLAAKELLPSEHYLDIGYVDAGVLVASQTDHNVTVIGPVINDPAWQAHTPTGITIPQFAIDWEERQAGCPQGKGSRAGKTAQDVNGNDMVGIQFQRDDWWAYPRQGDCTKSKSTGRSLSIRPREQHEAIQAARTRQQTVEFRRQYARRAGVEGTFTQANHHSDLRHARYIGLAKV